MSDSTDRDDDAPDSEEPEVQSEKPRAQATKAKSKAARPGAAKAAPPKSAAGMPVGRAGLMVVLALAAGGAAGWFGHIAQAKAAVERADAAPTGSAAPSDGPCSAWEAKICSTSGKESASCQQAKLAVELLTPSSCQAALNAVPATLAKIKAARSACDGLVKKLCTDLPPESPTCAMVKERTPSFPPKRCEEMLSHYDDVIGELRQIDKQGGLQQMGAPGMPPGTPIPAQPHDGHGH